MLVEWSEVFGEDVLSYLCTKPNQNKTNNNNNNKNNAYLKILPVIDLIASLICVLR